MPWPIYNTLQIQLFSSGVGEFYLVAEGLGPVSGTTAGKRAATFLFTAARMHFKIKIY